VADPDELDVARARFPVGEEVTGRVRRVPKPGVIGLFVDLGQKPEGFVDVLQLPREPRQWPPVGTVTTFEVLQHRPGQLRLSPLDDRFRSPDRLPGAPTPGQWLAIKDRFPVGAEVTATITGVYPANREYVVRFEDCLSTIEWTGDAPRVGTAGRYAITRHLDQTRRIMITPVTASQLAKAGPGRMRGRPRTWLPGYGIVRDRRSRDWGRSWSWVSDLMRPAGTGGCAGLRRRCR